MLRNSSRRKLIVLEGIDGVGKTTASRLLAEALNQREPGSAIRFEDLAFDNPTRGVRRACGQDHEAEFLAHVLSAIFKDREIRRRLLTTHVIADRYIYSAIAHHAARGVDTDTVDLSRLSILEPDHAFLLTAEESVRRQRLVARGNMNDGDRRVHSPGSELDAIEHCFARHLAVRIDTTFLTTDQVLMRILDVVFGNDPRDATEAEHALTVL